MNIPPCRATRPEPNILTSSTQHPTNLMLTLYQLESTHRKDKASKKEAEVGSEGESDSGESNTDQRNAAAEKKRLMMML